MLNHPFPELFAQRFQPECFSSVRVRNSANIAQTTFIGVVSHRSLVLTLQRVFAPANMEKIHEPKALGCRRSDRPFSARAQSNPPPTPLRIGASRGLNWEEFGRKLHPTHASTMRDSGVCTQLMGSLHFSQYQQDLSDEEVIAKRVPNVCRPLLSGMQFFYHRASPMIPQARARGEPAPRTNWRRVATEGFTGPRSDCDFSKDSSDPSRWSELSPVPKESNRAVSKAGLERGEQQSSPSAPTQQR
jgi:hypothetical protein